MVINQQHLFGSNKIIAYICCYKIVKIMKTEKEKLQELLDSKYSEGLKHGMWIGGISIGILIFLLFYFFPLP